MTMQTMDMLPIKDVHGFLLRSGENINICSKQFLICRGKDGPLESQWLVCVLSLDIVFSDIQNEVLISR